MLTLVWLMSLEFDPFSKFMAPGVQAFILSDHDYSPQYCSFIYFIQIQANLDTKVVLLLLYFNKLPKPNSSCFRCLLAQFAGHLL